MDWIADYIGLPFKEHGRDRNGCDCWGLVCCTYREQLGIELPLYTDYQHTKDPAISHLIVAGSQLWSGVINPRPFDVAVFNIYGRPMHVGLVVSPGRMLHIERGIDACIQDYTGHAWGKRLEGIYRYG